MSLVSRIDRATFVIACDSCAKQISFELVNPHPVKAFLEKSGWFTWQDESGKVKDVCGDCKNGKDSGGRQDI